MTGRGSEVPTCVSFPAMSQRIVASLLVASAMLLCAILPAAPAESDTPDTQRDDLIDFGLDADDDLSIIDSAERRESRLDQFTVRENSAFSPGERLVYSVRYGFIQAGEAALEVRREAMVAGRPCYQIVGTAKSSDFFSSIFRVNDRVESYLDTLYLIPWRFEKELNEGKFHASEHVEMDQINRVATYLDGRTFEMVPEAQDMISAIYHLRTLDLDPGDVVVVKTHADRQNVDIEIHIGERKRVKTSAGEFDCLEAQPFLLLDTGLYDHKKGKLLMYLTDDERRLPVMFKIKVFFGSIVMSLSELSLAEDS